MKIIFQLTGILIIALTSYTFAGTDSDLAPQKESIDEMLVQAQELRYSGDYDEGIVLASKARALSASLANPETELEAIYQLALLYYQKHEYSRARAELEVGLARARVHELEQLEADFLAAEGVLEWKQGNLHLALPKLQAAMVIRERRQDYISMASICNNIGIIYYTLKNYEDAEFYYRKGLELLDDSDNVRMRSSLYSNLAEILIPMDRLEEAEEYLFAALEMEEKNREPQQLGYTYYNLGELYSQKGDSVKAIDYYNLAFELQNQIGDDWAMALTHLKTSQEYLKTGDLDKSLHEAELGYDLVVGLNAISHLRDYSLHFIKIYRELGDEGRVQFYTDQNQWLNERTRLDEPVPDMEEPLPAEPVIQVQNESISPVQTVIIIILAVLIVILILENSRLRNRMAKL